MRKISIVVLLLVIVARADAAQGGKSKRVLFVGVDGTRFDALEAAKTPQFDALRNEGAWSTATRVLGERFLENDTVSGPRWSSLLCGVWADKHGVMDNEFKGTKSYPTFLERPSAVTSLSPAM